ncbi:MAG TPA: HEPN domain-containing protein [Bryobacteraceae bacterium]|nr:HEPN domain-containing protein [Bryobacteraceae bacterium]
MGPERPIPPPGSPGQWLEFAESDLRLAEVAAADAVIRREQACFHAQQAAEKAIKAVLVLHKAGFPYTHSLEHLLALAERHGIPLPAPVREAGFLTPYAVEARYPGPWPPVSEAELQNALRIAGEVVEWARKIIRQAQQAEP